MQGALLVVVVIKVFERTAVDKCGREAWFGTGDGGYGGLQKD
jgi:hypothetical protein